MQFAPTGILKKEQRFLQPWWEATALLRPFTPSLNQINFEALLFTRHSLNTTYDTRVLFTFRIVKNAKISHSGQARKLVEAGDFVKQSPLISKNHSSWPLSYAYCFKPPHSHYCTSLGCMWLTMEVWFMWLHSYCNYCFYPLPSLDSKFFFQMHALSIFLLFYLEMTKHGQGERKHFNRDFS